MSNSLFPLVCTPYAKILNMILRNVVKSRDSVVGCFLGSHMSDFQCMCDRLITISFDFLIKLVIDLRQFDRLSDRLIEQSITNT